MVQADATRNYYADLGVGAAADENEIRKAFRKLALQYHPDRNPGREAEFVTKFQQIQSAHEVLTDPTQRAKYDNERRKYRSLHIPPYNSNNNTTPRRPPPPPRNAYSTTTTPSGTYYRAPPPRPPQPPPPRPPPPQHHTTYANGADRFTSRNFRAPPTAQQQKPRPTDAEARANVFSAWQKMKQQNRTEEPPRTPNQNANNANNPNGTPFGRSKSTRMPSKKGFDPATPGADEGQARSAYRSNYERPVPSPPQPADPLKHFREQMGEDSIPQVPYAEGNRVRTPYVSGAGERTSMFGDGVGRSSSVRNSPTHGHRSTSSREGGSFSDSGRKRGNSYHGPGSKVFPQMYPSSSDEESGPELFRSPRSPPPANATNKPRASPLHQESHPPGTFGGPSSDGPAAFKSRSDETINMKFSPSDWHGKFEGSADYFNPTGQKGTTKGRTSPVRGRTAQRSATERSTFSGQSQPPPAASPFTMPGSTQMPPPPPRAPNGTESNFQRPAATATKFDQEAWAGTFREPSFVMPTSTKETSPRRGSTATKRPKGPARKSSTVPNGISKETESQAPRSQYQAFAEDANADADMMDIDSNTPPVEKPQPLATGADNTYKNGTPIKFSQTAPSSPQVEKASRRASVPNGKSAPQPDAPARNTRSQTSGLNGLSSLGTVEPLLPTKDAGLSGLGSLSDAMPFDSAASSSHPTKSTSARPLKAPPVPQAPSPPKTHDEAAIKSYLLAMKSYDQSYRKFSRTIRGHFNSRDAELDRLDDNYMLARGERRDKIGFASYKSKMEEDQVLMATWNVACEMHLKALKECEEVRNKALKLGALKGQSA